MAEKRVIAAEKQTGLKSINNLILVGIMMAVGVVLRLCASFLVLGNMHPNFLIATYCLSILIIRPNVKEAAIIGFISGFAFVGLAAVTYANPMPMVQFLNMALVTVVTAALNCVIVAVLSIPVDKIINKD